MAGNHRSLTRETALHDTTEVKQTPALEVKSEKPKANKQDTERYIGSEEVSVSFGTPMKHNIKKVKDIFAEPSSANAPKTAKPKQHAVPPTNVLVAQSVKKSPAAPNLTEIFTRDLVERNRKLAADVRELNDYIKDRESYIQWLETDELAQENLKRLTLLHDQNFLIASLQRQLAAEQAKYQILKTTNQELRERLNSRVAKVVHTTASQTVEHFHVQPEPVKPVKLAAVEQPAVRETKADVVEKEQEWETLSSASEKSTTPRASAIKGTAFNRVSVAAPARTEEDAVNRHRVGFHGS
jgi:hypothetical protein